MAEIAKIPSGLEVYTRQRDLPSRNVNDLQDQYPTACGQDEYPTAILQDEYPTACNADTKKAESTQENGGSLEKSAGAGLTAKGSRICGVGGLLFWLGLAMGVLIVLVGVVGGVLGSKIRKGAESRRCVLNNSPLLLSQKKKKKGWRGGGFFWQLTDSKGLDFNSAVHHQYPFPPPHPPHSQPRQQPFPLRPHLPP